MSKSDKDLTPDGYRIIPKREPPPDRPIERGIQCGECGMKFDHDKTYGWVCGHPYCPTQMKATL